MLRFIVHTRVQDRGKSITKNLTDISFEDLDYVPNDGEHVQNNSLNYSPTKYDWRGIAFLRLLDFPVINLHIIMNRINKLFIYKINLNEKIVKGTGKTVYIYQKNRTNI